MLCPACHFDNPPRMRFCGQCAARLGQTCGRCGFENPPGALACGGCAEALDAAAAPAAPTERRHLTVMFCDLVGSTALAEQLDPEDLQEVLRGYQGVASAAIRRAGGYVAQFLGDGILAYFGYPRAHEDDARRAVTAGLEVLAAVEELSRRTQAEQGLVLATRIGVHTGFVVVGEVGDGVTRERLALGQAPNVAARLEALAAPGTLLVSDATHRLLAGFFACEPRGTHALKGVSQPLPVWRVEGERGVRDRLDAAAAEGLTPFVGRSREVGALAARWREARAGRGRLVLVRGEAGIGKSRLVRALADGAAAEPLLRLDLAGAEPFANSALRPLSALLHQALGLPARPEPARRWRRLRAALRAAGIRDPVAPHLAARLLDLAVPEPDPLREATAAEVKRRTLALLVAWLTALAARRPVLLVAEDLHWVDPSTLELLALAGPAMGASRVLAVATCRPDLPPAWVGASGAEVVDLARLEREEVEAMAEGLAEARALPADLLARLLERTDGVPLFVEELARMAAELAAGEGRGEGGPAPTDLEAAIPDRLQDLLAARLDRLEKGREVAQAAAIIGREFGLVPLSAVLARERRELARDLERLVAAGIVVRRAVAGAAARGARDDVPYAFRHGLIQEAAYQSLLRRDRRLYHGRLAEALSAGLAGDEEAPPELLAHHFTAAGRAQEALGHWLEAGRRAVARSANLEASRHLERGLGLLRDRPPGTDRDRTELAFSLALGPTLITLRGFAAAEVEEVYLRALDLCHLVGEARQLFAVVWGLTRVYSAQARWLRARELAERLLALAADVGEEDLRLEAHRMMGSALYQTAELPGARDHLQQALKLFAAGWRPYEAALFLQPQVFCLFWMGYVLWHLGYPDQAAEKGREALELALAGGSAFGVGAARAAVAMIHQYSRQPEPTREAAEACVAFARDHGLPTWQAMGTVLRGWGRTETGDVEGGLADLRGGLADWRRLGMSLATPFFLMLLAEGCGRAGLVEEGLGYIEEGLRAVEETGERVQEAEMMRVRGELLLRLPSPDEDGAGASFRRAIEIARARSARSHELRATLALVRLEGRRGRSGGSLPELRRVYAGFAEGFSTPDLEEARRLLAEAERGTGAGRESPRAGRKEALRRRSRRSG